MPAVISDAHAQNRAADPHMRPHSPSQQRTAPGRETPASEVRGGPSRPVTENTGDVRGSVNVNIESLQEKVRPEGEFVDVHDLGRVWKPRDVSDDWKPYTNGHWIFNQKVGWYFES